MKILCDAALPDANEIFQRFGQVVLKAGRQITADDVKDIDALIVRSVTKVNEELLKDAKNLKFVGTATAGFDHIDTEYLKKRNIPLSVASGSNAMSVADYVLSVLLVLAQRYGLTFEGKSIGIIGCGNVGSLVEKKALALGLNVVKCDPPKLMAGDATCAASFYEALCCDIVTLHVPLNMEGVYSTYHMMGYKELMSMKKDAIFINASRGQVVNSLELFAVLTQRPDLKVWLDVFEGEPEIKCPELLNYVEGATPHIAGYSFESKIRASLMLADEMAKLFNNDSQSTYMIDPCDIGAIALGYVKKVDLDLISRLVFSVYDVRRDSAIFQNRFVDGRSFDEMRKNYIERREISSVQLVNVPDGYVELFSNLGFTTLTPSQAIDSARAVIEQHDSQ